jgi:hypothetical protein
MNCSRPKRHERVEKSFDSYLHFARDYEVHSGAGVPSLEQCLPALEVNFTEQAGHFPGFLRRQFDKTKKLLQGFGVDRFFHCNRLNSTEHDGLRNASKRDDECRGAPGKVPMLLQFPHGRVAADHDVL